MITLQPTLLDESPVGPPKELKGVLSPFRYPGGKSWLADAVVKWVAENGAATFIEPFAGGASVGLAVAASGLVDRVVLVELDERVAAVWETIFGGNHAPLVNRIRAFDIYGDVEGALNDTDQSRLEIAFRCLLHNRVARGGLMAPGAGLLKAGEDGRGFRSRWYADTLARRINYLATLSGIVEVVHGDGLAAISRAPADAALFVDPPYTLVSGAPGERLYLHHQLDHEALFVALAAHAGPKLVTYDDTDHIRLLAGRHGLSVETRAMRTTHHASKHELIIGAHLPTP